MPSHDLESQLLPQAAPLRHRQSAAPESALRPGAPLAPHDLLRLQREAGNEAVSELVAERSPVLDVVGRGGGSPLDAGIRADMEGRIGADFSDVRVHTDSAAHDSARAVGARAYTVGHDVVFQRDAFDPGSHTGRLTLAHELTHVVQQRSGPVAGTPSAGGIRVSDPGDSFETAAAANAERVLAQPAAGEHTHAHDSDTAPASSAPGVQLLAEESAAGSAAPAVQREEEEEEIQA